ncbi:MAG TPA: tripartite tricarboxylate transporter substrate binding protein, partial [Burkholderiales bacterium]|nr:tripartite tricarboxylate transporter substrate binding protein [Burkholderiales bacterium]
AIMRASVSRVTQCAVLACMTGLAAFQAAAQSGAYPNRPIRWIVPLPPGGGADTVARTIAASLSKSLGQQVLVDNRAGGGTVIGAELAARSTPDGYTWLLGTATTHAINASLVKKLPYDPIKDFVPVSLVAILAQVFVVHPSLPPRSLKELIALARKRPGEINFASTGNGSANQLAVEMLKSYAKIDMVHVPYKGAGPSMTDLLAGNIQFMSTTIPPAVAHFKSGRLIPLAVANAKRSALLPDVPTTAEAGAPGVEASSWNGLLLPAGTPKEIVARLHSEIVTVMKLSEVRERLLNAGVEPVVNTPAEFAAYIDAETARYAKVVRESGARVD